MFQFGKRIPRFEQSTWGDPTPTIAYPFSIPRDLRRTANHKARSLLRDVARDGDPYAQSTISSQSFLPVYCLVHAPYYGI